MAEGEVTQEELNNMSPEQVAELQKKNCVFCKIIKGEIPSRKVYEDDKMIAVMDIYPSVKGHILVMPKEHVPIMPLIPPEVFKHLFRKVKYLVKGVKNGVPSVKSNIFIANGAAAGQQSPHFLFHIIPRDDGDGLEVLEIPKKDLNQDSILPNLKTNLTKLFQSHLQKEGKVAVEPPKKEDLAQILESNPVLKKEIINNPENFKKIMAGNPQLQALFNGIDIEKLSMKLKELERNKGEVVDEVPPQAKEAEVEVSEEKNEDNDQEDEKEGEVKTNPESENIREEEKPKEEADSSKQEPEPQEEKETPKPKKNLLDDITNMFAK